MSLFTDHEIRDNLLNDLDEAIKIKKERGYDLANTECHYRIELSKAMALAMIQGIPQLDIDKKVAATVTYDLCRGIPEIAKLRQERDATKILMETVQERIYAIKARLRVVEQDIQNSILRGV